MLDLKHGCQMPLWVQGAPQNWVPKSNSSGLGSGLLDLNCTQIENRSLCNWPDHYKRNIWQILGALTSIPQGESDTRGEITKFLLVLLLNLGKGFPNWCDLYLLRYLSFLHPLWILICDWPLKVTEEDEGLP